MLFCRYKRRGEETAGAVRQELLWGDSGQAGDGDVCDSNDGNSPKQHDSHRGTNNSKAGGMNPATSSSANQQGGVVVEATEPGLMAI